ncbi:hypothetical protein KR067_002976 [Drosophila pandora]|nr:hypothetical protein KR067_002976 [Drosophila pandora]
MFAVSAVPKTTTTTAKKEKNCLTELSPNVMQHSPVVLPMCVQHSRQQQVPMLNTLMCMRMRRWHNNKIHCTNCFNTTTTLGTGTTGTKILKLKLKRSKLLRKKRYDIIRGSIYRHRFGFYRF